MLKWVIFKQEDPNYKGTMYQSETPFGNYSIVKVKEDPSFFFQMPWSVFSKNTKFSSFDEGTDIAQKDFEQKIKIGFSFANNQMRTESWSSSIPNSDTSHTSHELVTPLANLRILQRESSFVPSCYVNDSLWRDPEDVFVPFSSLQDAKEWIFDEFTKRLNSSLAKKKYTDMEKFLYAYK